MKLIDREPTDAMCIAAREKIGISANAADHIFQAMYDAAPEIKVDMEPLYSAEQYAQLAERDKTILEQQARITELTNTLKWYIEVYRVADEHRDKKAEVARLYKQEMGDDTDNSTLEAALKAERIKTLEDAASECFAREQAIECYHRLHEMANDLKEQS